VHAASKHAKLRLYSLLSSLGQPSPSGYCGNNATQNRHHHAAGVVTVYCAV